MTLANMVDCNANGICVVYIDQSAYEDVSIIAELKDEYIGCTSPEAYNYNEMEVVWEKSSDSDFKEVKLLYSNTEVNEKDTLFTSSNLYDTTFTILDFDPTIENWFWVGVEDTYGVLALGDKMSNQIESVPEPVNVISVNYEIDPENMYITWEQSGTNNFAYYTLYHAESQFESIDSIDVIPEIISTTYSLPFGDFDPTVENWFWVKVTNIWGLSSQLGTGLSNALDLSPQAVNVTNITCLLYTSDAADE